jgi:hypothetical protein
VQPFALRRTFEPAEGSKLVQRLPTSALYPHVIDATAIRSAWRALMLRLHRRVAEPAPTIPAPAQRGAPSIRWLLAGLAAIVLALGGPMWWWHTRKEPEPEPTSPAPAPETPPAPAPETPPPAPKAAAPQGAEATGQVEQQTPGKAQAPEALPSFEQSNQLVRQTLTDLTDRRAVPRFLRVDDIVRHLVVTIDNLPSAQAPVRLWPVNPTPGRFVVDSEGEDAVLSPDNARRYVPFVKFVESVDTGKAVALYVELYPLFQRAYGELGYPDRQFNDRLLEVIDHLLDAPDVTGSVELFRPGVMYEYADPDLELRSAGQKILMRMGSANAARLKAKLREIRAHLAATALTK